MENNALTSAVRRIRLEIADKGAPTFHAFIKLQYYRHASFISNRYANYRSIRILQ